MVMRVEPVGLPAALKAWHQRDPEAVLSMRCSVAGCGAEVGAAYRTPHGIVVESRISAPEAQRKEVSPMDLAQFADGLGVTGLLEGFEDIPDEAGQATGGDERVRAQIDLLHSQLYWHDPQPLCPTHGTLTIERAALAAAVRDGQDVYELGPA